MSRWDQVRADIRRDSSAGLPHCSRCRGVSVFNPCRRCATPAELAATRIATSRGEPFEVPVYPPLSGSSS